MSSVYGPDGRHHEETKPSPASSDQTLECQLFESLMHHLMEKGVLTKNDALSVVQTVAEVERGTLEERNSRAVSTELQVLKRMYSSFELVQDRPFTSQTYDTENVLQLRPPLHGNHPEFPTNA